MSHSLCVHMCNPVPIQATGMLIDFVQLFGTDTGCRYYIFFQVYTTARSSVDQQSVGIISLMMNYVQKKKKDSLQKVFTFWNVCKNVFCKEHLTFALIVVIEQLISNSEICAELWSFYVLPWNVIFVLKLLYCESRHRVMRCLFDGIFDDAINEVLQSFPVKKTWQKSNGRSFWQKQNEKLNFCQGAWFQRSCSLSQ